MVAVAAGPVSAAFAGDKEERCQRLPCDAHPAARDWSLSPDGRCWPPAPVPRPSGELTHAQWYRLIFSMCENFKKLTKLSGD